MSPLKDWKKFGDKKYQVVTRHDKKQWATNSAEDLRRRGYLARIVPGKVRGKTVYYVYSRGTKKKK